MKRSYGVQLEFPYELIQDITAENIAEFNSKLEAAERIKIEENLRKREEQIQAANAAKPREHSYSNPGLNSRLRQAPTSFIYGRNGVRDSTFFVTAVATHVHGVLSSNSTSPSSSKPASAAPTLPTIAAHS